MLKPIEFESLMQTIRDAYQYKLKLQKRGSIPGEEGSEESDSEVSGIRRALKKLRKLYGVHND